MTKGKPKTINAINELRPLDGKIDNFKVNLNQFKLNFSDQDSTINYRSKLATIIIILIIRII
jgi:hypothetical protein